METYEQIAMNSLGEKQMRAKYVPEDLRALEARCDQQAGELERIHAQTRLQENALDNLRARAHKAREARTNADELIACQLPAIDAETALLRFISSSEKH